MSIAPFRANVLGRTSCSRRKDTNTHTHSATHGLRCRRRCRHRRRRLVWVNTTCRFRMLALSVERESSQRTRRVGAAFFCVFTLGWLWLGSLDRKCFHSMLHEPGQHWRLPRFPWQSYMLGILVGSIRVFLFVLVSPRKLCHISYSYLFCCILYLKSCQGFRAFF